MHDSHSTATTVKAWSHSTPPFPSTLSCISISIPDPDQLNPNDLLIEIYSASLNPVDVQLSNLPIFRLPSFANSTRGLGKDFVGKLLAKGTNVKEYEIGDELMGVTFNPLGNAITGTLSQISLIDTTRSCIIRKPPTLTHAQAASLPLVFLTAKTCLSPPYLHLPRPTTSTTSGEIRKPTIVILGGSSAVGIYSIQYAKLKLDLNVITTCSTRNVQFLVSLGVATEEIIDYTKESVVDRLKAMKPLEGYSSIIDCVGGITLFADGIWNELLSSRDEGHSKQGGSYVTIVGDKTNREKMGGSITNYWNFNQLLRTLKGWLGFGPRYHCISLNMEKKEWLQEIDELVVEQGMKIVLDEEFSFDKAPQAFEKLNKGKSRGKIVVNVKSPI